MRSLPSALGAFLLCFPSCSESATEATVDNSSAAAGEKLVPCNPLMAVSMNPADIATFELHNLPGEVTVEYNAGTQDGRRFVVTRPRDEWAYQDFRVFLGDQRSLVERAVVDVMRTKTGQTSIRFDIEGTDATALFPAPGSATEAANLNENGRVSTLVDAGVLDPEQVSFHCLTGAQR